jgi:transcriptional regulator with XRE-family HTH domain
MMPGMSATLQTQTTPTRRMRPGGKRRFPLRDARESVGMTQKQLAHAAGCTPATISDLESGRNHDPSHTKAVNIYRALQKQGLSHMAQDDVFPIAEPRTDPSAKKAKKVS